MDPDFTSNLISTLIGTIAGAALAYWFALRQFKHELEADYRQKQIDTALDLFEDWTSDGFWLARAETRRVFEEYAGVGDEKDFCNSLPEQKKQSVLKVLAFFRRLQLVVQYDRIDEEMAKDLFSGEFIRLYFEWLNMMVPDNWSSRTSIDKLNEWLRNSMSPEVYEEKKQLALNERTKRQVKYLGKTPPDSTSATA